MVIPHSMAISMKTSPFFLLVILILIVPRSAGYAQSLGAFQKGDYAEYDVKAAFIEFSNYTTINEKSHEFIQGTLKWTVIDINDTKLVLALNLKISYLDYMKKVFIENRKAYFENGTEWGYFPLWVDNVKIGDDLNISGSGISLSVGRAVEKNVLRNTPKGWQECYAVDAVSSPKVFNRTLIPWYVYDMDSGILVEMSADDPIWTLLGDFTIAGNVALKSTNVDLGSQSFGYILYYLSEIWPVILLACVFFIGYYLHRRRKGRSRQKTRGKI